MIEVRWAIFFALWRLLMMEMEKFINQLAKGGQNESNKRNRNKENIGS